MIPGEIRVADQPLDLNQGREKRTVIVVNNGDRPIQIGSALHLPDANPALDFDREETRGFRIDVPAGTSIRFEPGVSRTVAVVALGGRREVPGLQVRDLAQDDIPYEREPRQVVPFGTPGSEVVDPPHAAGPPKRVSDEPATDTTQVEEREA